MLMHISRWMGLVGGLGLMVAMTGARPVDNEIPLDQIPMTVRDAITMEFPQARIQRVEEEQEHGRPLFDVDLIQDGRDIGLMVAPDGTILKVEKELDPADLPRAVTDAVKAHKFGTIRWAEETTRGDRRRYGVIVANADRGLREVELDAQGRLLDVDRD